jgi:2'-5' RNA ligase
MRLFVAVTPPLQWRQKVATRVDPVRRLLDRCSVLRWTRPESWHLTLQFLGEWPEERVPGLERGLAGFEAGDSFVLHSLGLGAFPHLSRPRVLFLQLDSDGKAEKLARLVRESVAGVWPDGPQDSKPFRAHLTLARVKGTLTRAEKEVLAGLDLTGLPEVEARDFRLISSALLPGGAQHRDLAVFPLNFA